MIIIACGTVSSAVLPWINDEIPTEITGVVEPAVTAAVKNTKNGKIGVLGTAGTVRSGKYPEYIKQHMPSAEVFQKACPMFVPLVENGYAESDVTRMIAAEYLEEIKNAGVDTLILGCTHYPILKPVISEIMGDGVRLIDSGAAAADYAFALMRDRDMLAESDGHGEYRYFVSDTAEDFARLGGFFLNRPIGDGVKQIDIERY